MGLGKIQAGRHVFGLIAITFASLSALAIAQLNHRIANLGKRIRILCENKKASDKEQNDSSKNKKEFFHICFGYLNGLM